MNLHKPEYWHFEKVIQSVTGAIITDGNGNTIARVMKVKGVENFELPYEANARLISSAPDLRDALLEILESAGEHITSTSDESLRSMLDDPDCTDDAKRQIKALLMARSAVAKATGGAS